MEGSCNADCERHGRTTCRMCSGSEIEVINTSKISCERITTILATICLYLGGPEEYIRILTDLCFLAYNCCGTKCHVATSDMATQL